MPLACSIWRFACSRIAIVGLTVALSLSGAESTEARRIKVAALSFVPVKLDLQGNADRLEAAFRAAAAGGAQLAVAPEGILDGYVINPMLAGEIPVARMREVAIPIDGPLIERFRALARELSLCLVFGFAEQVGADVFNTALFIDDQGRLSGKYHKMQFDEGYHPSWWFNRLGKRSRAFDTPLGRCGLLICNDRWNPVLAQIPALDGAQFLLIPAYGSTSRAQDAAVIARARETRLPVIEANVGLTLVVNSGEVVATDRAEQAITFAEIEIPAARAAQTAERDSVEREFLTWREGEMALRYERKKHRVTPEEILAATP